MICQDNNYGVETKQITKEERANFYTALGDKEPHQLFFGPDGKPFQITDALRERFSVGQTVR